MADEQIVQPDAVPEGTELPEVEAQVTEPPQQQPLSEERIRGIIAEAGEKATREIQSVKDKARHEVEAAQRRAIQAESTLGVVRGKMSELDPDTASAMRLAELETRDRYYRDREAQEGQVAQYRQTHDAFHQNMNQFITGMGLDPSDKRIDWGTESEPLLAKQEKILASVGKISKETTKSAEEKLRQELKDTEARLRKDLGIDSVDTSTPVGVSKGIPTNLTTFRKWVKGLSTAEYAEKQKDIEEMLDKGQIR